MTREARNIMVGASIISNTIALCSAKGLEPISGQVQARVIVGKNGVFDITFPFPNIHEDPSKSVDFVMRNIPLESDFSLRIDLLKGIPDDGSKICSLSGTMRVQYRRANKRLISAAEGIMFEGYSGIPGAHCTKLKDIS